MRRGLLIRLTLGVVFATFGLVGLSLRGPAAHAGEISVCYTDPVVTLSNGATIDLSDTVNDSYLDLQHIDYVLHAPAGTYVTSVTYTSGPIGPKESLQFYADQAANHYRSTSDVTTNATSVSVTAYATVASTAWTQTSSAQGWNSQAIPLALAP